MRNAHEGRHALYRMGCEPGIGAAPIDMNVLFRQSSAIQKPATVKLTPENLDRLDRFVKANHNAYRKMDMLNYALEVGFSHCLTKKRVSGKEELGRDINDKDKIRELISRNNLPVGFGKEKI